MFVCRRPCIASVACDSLISLMLSSLAAIPSRRPAADSYVATSIRNSCATRVSKIRNRLSCGINTYRQTYEKNKTKIVSQAKGHCNIDVVKMRIYRNPNSICFLWYSSPNAVPKPEVHVRFAFGIYDSGPERCPLTFVTVINVDLNVAASTFHDTASRLKVIGKLGMPKVLTPRVRFIRLIGSCLSCLSCFSGFMAAGTFPNRTTLHVLSNRKFKSSETLLTRKTG